MTDREFAWREVWRELRLGSHPGRPYICRIALGLLGAERITTKQYNIIIADTTALQLRMFVYVSPYRGLWPAGEVKERMRFARLAKRGWGDLYDYPLAMREDMERLGGWEFKEEPTRRGSGA